MKHARTRLFSALLTVYGVVGATSFAQAQAACTQTTIDSGQNDLRINAGQNICATNSGSVTAVSGLPTIGVEIIGPGDGSAMLSLTNTSSGNIVAEGGSAQGISVDSGKGLTATIVNEGTVLVVGTDSFGTSRGIQASDGFATENLLTIQNRNSIDVRTAGSGSGIYFNQRVVDIQNTGIIEVTVGINATALHEVHGIYSDQDSVPGGSSRISNTNQILVTSQRSSPSAQIYAAVYGIRVQGGAVSNSGEIVASNIAGESYGIKNVLSAGSGSVTNTGFISARIDDGYGYGIWFEGSGNVTNARGVTVGGYSGQGYDGNQASLTKGVGIYFSGEGVLTNTGTVGVRAGSGELYGIQQQANGSGGVNGGGVSSINRFNNSGTITAQVANPDASNSSATGVQINALASGSISAINSGTIITQSGWANDGSDKAVGVHLAGQNITFNNTGTIKAQGSTARAIEVVSTNTIVELGKNSVIVGDIYTNQQGNVLRHKVGAAQAYVLETTGDWILEDLDGRAVVTGSSMAAGVGWAETADEMLFERTQMFLQSMDRGQTRRDLSGDSAAWVDPYAFNSKRSASGSDPTVVKYSSNGFGLTLGYDFKAFGLKAQAIGNIQSGRLNIEDNTQDIDSTSWLLGLRLPSFYEVGSVSFSAMALAGRNHYSSDNQVLTNATSTGMTTYSSSFGSTQLLFGLGAKYSTPIAESTNLSLKADLYLSQEYLEGYQEGPYFSWNSRTMTQGSAFLEAGVDHQVTDQWLLQAKLGANTQKLFSGATTSYSINNTPVSFSGGQTSDTGLYAMLGTQYQVQDNASVGLSVWYGQTSNSVKTIQGMLEAKFLF
jgi:hypothetical protein